jgi:hypothetical protein
MTGTGSPSFGSIPRTALSVLFPAEGPWKANIFPFKKPTLQVWERELFRPGEAFPSLTDCLTSVQKRTTERSRMPKIWR